MENKILIDHRKSDPSSGLMFYNNDGDEVGGLIYGNKVDEEGNYTAMASLTLDQYKQDQVVQIIILMRMGIKNMGFQCMTALVELHLEYVLCI